MSVTGGASAGGAGGATTLSGGASTGGNGGAISIAGGASTTAVGAVGGIVSATAGDGNTVGGESNGDTGWETCCWALGGPS